MKHVLTRAVLGCNTSIDLTPDEFQDILNAHDILSEALTIEEQYLALIFNYEELEKELISHAVTLTITFLNTDLWKSYGTTFSIVGFLFIKQIIVVI